MKILGVGDSHGVKVRVKNLNKFDLILLTGDMGKSEKIRTFAFKCLEEKKDWQKELLKLDKQKISEYVEEIVTTAREFLEDLNNRTRPRQVFTVLGNVDTVANISIHEKDLGFPTFQNMIDNFESIHLLEEQNVVLENGINLIGNSFSFQRESIDHKKFEKLSKLFIQNKFNIFLSHYPPLFTTLDYAHKNLPKTFLPKHVGGKTELEILTRKKPDLFVCGHIHESKGMESFGKSLAVNCGSKGDCVSIQIEDKTITKVDFL